MKVNEVAASLIGLSGMSANAVSAALGRSREWARQAARPDRTPRLDTVADIADACGCDIVIVRRETGERVGVVEPPRGGRPGE